MRIQLYNLNYEINDNIEVSPDKSITHRSIILGSIALGETVVNNYLKSEDCLATIAIMRNLGVEITKFNNNLRINGVGLYGLKEPHVILDAKNSGTSMRLISGLLAAQDFVSVISGDSSLNKRPMKRIIDPLKLMGANIVGRAENMYAPMCILKSKNLRPIDFKPNVASAQVKSCVLLASLYIDGTTTIKEKSPSRDHTEKMLKAMGANIATNNDIELTGGKELVAQTITVPGDISSAAYFISLVICSQNSELVINNVGINETRIGFLNALVKMGADISIINKRVLNNEPIGDIHIKSSILKSTIIEKNMVATLIDEIPILAVVASHAKGLTIIKGVEELRHKESNRLVATINELRKLGINIYEQSDSLYIEGNNDLSISGNEIEFCHYNDHRIAMSMAIASLTHKATSVIKNCDVVNISCPDFWLLLKRLVPDNIGEY